MIAWKCLAVNVIIPGALASIGEVELTAPGKSALAKAGLVMTIIASLLLTGTLYGLNFCGLLLFRL
jgi:hypothetical protein